MAEKQPIILVTGANGGVGFGICHRFLIQLAQQSPPDASPSAQKSPITLTPAEISPYLPVNGLTLILACRSQQRAEAARNQLFQLLDEELARQKANQLNTSHGEKLRKNLKIEIVSLDLSSVESVFACAADVRRRFPYISHMILNAGLGAFSGIDWLRAVYEVLTDLKAAVTSPGFKIQTAGKISGDGLGWVWECNVFGHYVLVRALRDMLAKSPYDQSRVLWMSSIEGRPSFFPGIDDWQLVKTAYSYEASKYSTELLACTLDMAEARAARTPGESEIRHFVVHPGVAGTNIFIEHTGWFLSKLMLLAFYLARLLGSPHHPISTYKAAISSVHIALVSLVVLPSIATHSDTNQKPGQPPSDAASHSTTRESDYQPVRYGAETNMWGTEYVGVQPVEGWEVHKDIGAKLLARCGQLYEAFEKKTML